MIHTIDWLKKEAQGIISAWDGFEERFTYEGETYTEEDVEIAEELLKKVEELDALTDELGI